MAHTVYEHTANSESIIIWGQKIVISGAQEKFYFSACPCTSKSAQHPGPLPAL